MAPQTVLITGCSSGIGHALALEFKSRGFRVFATARQTTSITDLAGLGIETLALEATSAESIARLKEEIASKTGGKLDYLVNNAGRSYTVPALEVEKEEIEATFAVNVFAVMMLTQALAPLLLEAKGNVVMIGSLAGEMPYVFGSVYCASKAALHRYTETLRLELKPFGVRVVNVVTGGVKSRIARTFRELRGDSIYLSVRGDFEKRLTHSQSLGMETESYARSVVGQLVGWRGKTTIWEGEFLSFFLLSDLDWVRVANRSSSFSGSKSWLVWWLTGYMPRFILVSFERKVYLIFSITMADCQS